jgi:hypothetical protein
MATEWQRNSDPPRSSEAGPSSPTIERHVRKTLHVDEDGLEGVLFCHGKPNWPDSKVAQNVHVFGVSNTGDVFIEHRRVGTVFIELKLSKRVSKKTATRSQATRFSGASAKH